MTRHASNLSPAMQDYPRNQWYVAAWSSEVGRELLARQFLDVPVVLYRTEAGQPVALADTCPHRSFPLSKGKLIGDVVQCGYHGMEFGPQGKCVRIPQQETIPARMATRSFPLIEKWQWIWIWMGDTAKADPALLPDHYDLGLERSNYSAAPFGMMRMEANYQFMHDNLLDSSHVTYLHAGLLDSGDMANSTFWVEDKEQIVRFGRQIPDHRVDEAIARYFRVKPHHPYQRTLLIEQVLPCISNSKMSMRDLADPSWGPQELYAINALTPASKSATYVFHVQVTSYDARWIREDFAGVRAIIDQDRVAIEILQERFNAFGPSDECSVKSDGAGLICRKRLAEMIAKEQTDAVTDPLVSGAGTDRALSGSAR
jgi:phenylpropionate dioxygenase-like ring-hydroxylating dioxygenase large terminal subunit